MWPFAQRPYLVKQPVIATVIEFYVPKNFRSPNKQATEMGFGKVIEFPPLAKKSA
jgi:hypothetical protein